MFLELTWTAPETCAQVAEIEAAVGRLVGTSDAAGGALRVQGRVREEGGRFRVVLVIADSNARSERQVEAPSCELATEAAIVVIAMPERSAFRHRRNCPEG